MSTPTNLVIDPSTAQVGGMPLTANIQGTDIFERPDYTDRELFTQTGSDIPVTTWNTFNDIPQECIIGLGAQFQSGYLDSIPMVSKIFNPLGNYFGFSLRFKSGSPGTQTLLAFGTASNQPPIVLSLYTSGALLMYVYGPSGAATERKVHISDQTTYNDGNWHHVWVSIDLSDPTNLVQMVVDGTDTGNSLENDNVSSFKDFDSVYLGRTKQGSNFYSGLLNQFYWSYNSSFSAHLSKYANLPTAGIN